MSTELFDQLEQKVTQAIETIELLQMEVDELRQDNQRLKSEREQWEGRLGKLVAQFGSLNAQTTPSDTTPSAPEAAPSHQQPTAESAPAQPHSNAFNTPHA